jgi:CheY-like chemotaxis protein
MSRIEGDLAGVRVLLVDDSDDAPEIFGSYLRHVGAVVTLARNGAEALGFLEQVRAHVIVTDLSMPGMDGFEFVARFRGHRGEDSAPTPVTAVSAFPDFYGESHVSAAGFRSYLVKPVDPARLAREIRRIFDYGHPDDDGVTGRASGGTPA